MVMNGHIVLVTASLNVNFRSIMNIQGSGATKTEKGINTTISAFTELQINVETTVVNSNFGAVCESLILVNI